MLPTLLNGILSAIFESMRAIASRRGRPFTLVPTGSLTNVALLLLTFGAKVLRVFDSIVFMGGSVREGGNTSPTAKFNIQNDPEAAKVRGGTQSAREAPAHALCTPAFCTPRLRLPVLL